MLEGAYRSPFGSSMEATHPLTTDLNMASSNVLHESTQRSPIAPDSPKQAPRSPWRSLKVSTSLGRLPLLRLQIPKSEVPKDRVMRFSESGIIVMVLGCLASIWDLDF